jgi:hypothetical protein
MNNSMINRNFLLLLVLSFFVNVSFAQLNFGDYTDAINGYYAGVDTQYQLFSQIKTIQDEEKLINQNFKFQTNKFKHSYDKILPFDSLTFTPEVDFTKFVSWANDSNYYFAGHLNFVHESDTSRAYFYMNNTKFPNQKIKTAFLIFPGSGINQATAVSLFNPGNYHNHTCAIADFCSSYGDVFTFVRPNDDFASLWTVIPGGDRRKMNYTALTSKTNMLNKNWAANCMIQFNALIKYLKAKYHKVIVLGLSAGAWGAMFTSMQAEPDASVIASGYSINFNDYPLF